MSAGLPEDRKNTKAQLEKPTPPEGEQNWLRHGEDTQAALIDQMLLEGTYSLEEMAEKLKEHDGRKLSLKVRIGRIKSHFAHLEEKWNGKMGPHGLKLREVKGKWRFDCG